MKNMLNIKYQSSDLEVIVTIQPNNQIIPNKISLGNNF